MGVALAMLQICLLGKFQAQFDELNLQGLYAVKVQELFSYLLLNRDRPHHRENLGGLLWGDAQTSQAKKYLRQTLWQLQTAFNPLHKRANQSILNIESEWISINPEADFWLDVKEFEHAISLVREIPGQDLDRSKSQTLKDAVRLYKGDLLEGCYQDWCIFERERFLLIYLEMLYKLMRYCETHCEYETGLAFGEQVLRYDRAHEQTHYQLMRFYSLSGDRTGALRQFERCAAALVQELGVQPSKKTIALYEQIRADRAIDSDSSSSMDADLPASAAVPAQEMLRCLRRFRSDLLVLQKRVDQNLQILDKTLKNKS